MYPPNNTVINIKLVIILIKLECLLFEEINADKDPIIADIKIGTKLMNIAPTKDITALSGAPPLMK